MWGVNARREGREAGFGEYQFYFRSANDCQQRLIRLPSQPCVDGQARQAPLHYRRPKTPHGEQTFLDLTLRSVRSRMVGGRVSKCANHGFFLVNAAMSLNSSCPAPQTAQRNIVDLGQGLTALLLSPHTCPQLRAGQSSKRNQPPRQGSAQRPGVSQCSAPLPGALRRRSLGRSLGRGTEAGQ